MVHTRDSKHPNGSTKRIRSKAHNGRITKGQNKSGGRLGARLEELVDSDVTDHTWVGRRGATEGEGNGEKGGGRSRRILTKQMQPGEGGRENASPT